MSRFIWALCAFVFTATPVVAMASHSTDFERPQAFRHAVNPLIGDASFIDRFGAPPTPATDPQLRVSTHLSFVHEVLSRRDASVLTPLQRDARRQNLARLREYIDAGVFPQNSRYRDETRPCFIDDDGRICAVGYLVEQSVGRAAAERINATFQYAFLSEMESPEIEEWIAASGLSRIELSLIQPCYDPEFNVTVTQTAGLTVSIRGSVFDYCCGVKYTMFDFGEAVWASTKSYYGSSVNISHTYSSPGTYVITCAAMSTDWCGNEVETKKWMVNVGAAVINVSAVELPGGPPYNVYLTTTEALQVGCLTSSTAQWEANGPLVPTSWYLENGVYRTPVRQYATAGVKKIQVMNTYLANCTTNQMGTVTVNVNGVPGSAEATHVVSTWGAIKAMYR